MSVSRWVLCLALILSPAVAAAGRILLNELLYDPEGSDSGHEFVEICADSGQVLSLEGLRLEFCNGAAPGQWTLLWEAAPGDSLPRGRPFLIGEAAVNPAPDAICVLGIQNGPDAIRLTRADQVLDLLGWGVELPGELAEGWPAEDLSNGRSLSRRPDGVDTDQNALDWFATDSTPGRWNFPALRVRLLGAYLPYAPIPPGQAWPLRVLAENQGREPWPADLPVVLGELCEGLLPAVLPGHSSETQLTLPPLASGLHAAWLKASSSLGDLTDSLFLEFRVGGGPLILSEVLFAPPTGRSEWVEVLARETVSGPFRLRDLAGNEGVFMAPLLVAGERILLCQDRESLLEEFPLLPADRVLECAPWPSLSNSGSSVSDPPWTDGLLILDESGIAGDGMTYLGEWISDPGRSLERMSIFAPVGQGAWSPCPSGSSPLEGHDPREPVFASGWKIHPQPFDPRRGPVEFLMAGVEGGRAQLRLFDAAGRGVQCLEGSLAAGSLRLLWDGSDDRGRALPGGAYPYLLSWETGVGSSQRKGVCLLRREHP